MATKKKSTSRSGATKRSSSKRSSSSPKGRAKVGKVMREFKHGQLKSGGRKKVKSRKQAIAIGLSEARRSGAKVAPPKRKGAAGKGAAKKSGGRKSSKRS